MVWFQDWSNICYLLVMLWKLNGSCIDNMKICDMKWIVLSCTLKFDPRHETMMMVGVPTTSIATIRGARKSKVRVRYKLDISSTNINLGYFNRNLWLSCYEYTMIFAFYTSQIITTFHLDYRVFPLRNRYFIVGKIQNPRLATWFKVPVVPYVTISDRRCPRSNKNKT